MIFKKTLLILLAALIYEGLTTPAFSQSNEYVIDEIEISGVTILSQQEIESALDVKVGDSLERSTVSRSVRNFEILYQNKGYEQVSIQSSVLRKKQDDKKIKTILLFSVKEGLPTLIFDTEIIVDTELKELVSLIQSKQSFRRSDIFSREKLNDMTKSIERVLIERDYVGGKVLDVQVVPVLATDLPENEQKKSGTNWVKLKIRVAPGEKISFGFRGNNVFTHNQLKEIIEEQRVLGFSQDYVDVIQSKIIEMYRLKGFANVNVSHYTFKDHKQKTLHISYFINEGDRIKIDSIFFEGNFVYTEAELEDKFKELAPVLVQRRYYVEKEIDKAADLLSEWLQSNGYLSAKKISISKTFVPEKKSVRILVYLYEGDQTIVKDIQFEGNQKFSADEIKNILGVEANRPLNLFLFGEGLEKLKQTYRDAGFLDVSILNEKQDNVVRYFQKNRLADIYLNFKEGVQYRTGEITIDGLQKTKEYIVRRELQIKEGDILEGEKIRESESRLRKLGIFSSVAIQHRNDPEREGVKQIRVLIQEGTPGIYAVGLGVRNDLGGRAFGEVAYTNLWNRNHTISLTAIGNRRIEGYRKTVGPEYEIKSGYIWPWFLIDEMNLRQELAAERQQYIQFAADTVSFRPTLEKRLFKRVNLIGALTYSLERTKQFDAVDALDNQTLRIGALIPSLRLDLRDNPLAPTSGFYSSVSYEHAASVFFSQERPFPVEYARVQWRSDYFVPVSQRGIVWFLSFRTGIERNLALPSTVDGGPDPRVGIPLVKQFALGGVSSLRGYKVQELNVYSDKVIQGSLSYVNYRTQVDFPLTGAMKVGPFLDAANLLVDRYSLGMLRYGVGFGFHYVTPVGPINFDWGFKIEPKPNEDPYQFHFSIGVL